MELLIIWDIIRQRKWVIIQVFLVVFLTAFLGAMLLPPVYESSINILAQTPGTTAQILSNVALMTDSSGRDSGSMNLEISDHVEMLSLDPVLNKIISLIQLRGKDGNLIKPRDLTKKMLILYNIQPKPYVEVEQVEETALIEIKGYSSEPEEAEMLANAVAEAYLQENIEMRRNNFRSIRDFVLKQIEIRRADYITLVDDLGRFKLTEKTVDLELETKSAIDKVVELIKDKEKIAINHSMTTAKLVAYKTQLNRENIYGVSSDAISESPIIESLRKTLNDIELTLAEILLEKKPEHPDVVSLIKKQEAARRELEKELSLLKKTSRDLNTFKRELASLEAQRKGVDVDLERSIEKLYRIPAKGAAHSHLNLKISIAQKYYIAILEFLYQIGVVELAALNSIQLIAPATVPDVDQPDSPNKILILIAGSFLGMMLGLGIAFIQAFVDDSIKEPEEIIEAGLQLLGTVRVGGRRKRLIADRDPKDPFVEDFRTVRHSIDLICEKLPVSSLLLISPLSREGRTQTVANLAISLAREGRNVLVIDADLRKPGIHELFHISGRSGLSSVLEGKADAHEVITETRVSGVSVLPAGPLPSDPGGLIETNRMQQLISDLAREFEWVLIDSPAIINANDALVLARYVDTSIMVFRRRRTPRKSLTYTQQLHKDLKSHFLGVIFNVAGE